MNILGVSFLSDASACVLRDGHIVSAVSEERLNRIKLWNGVPYKAIEQVLHIAGLTLDDIDFIATHGLAPSMPDRAPFEEKARWIGASLTGEAKQRQLDALWGRYEHECSVLSSRTPRYLAELKALGRPMKIYRHHDAHAASAYFGSGWDSALVVTADGWGEDASHTLSHCKGTQINRLSHSHSFDSLGYFYGSVTKALGFIPHRHEGKVLGLAAHCAAPESYAELRRMVDVDLINDVFRGRMENGLYLPRFENTALADYVAKFPREDVAASTQRILEEVVSAHVAKQGETARRLCVAGGIFANVKLNQRLAELPNVEELYVYPNMGDGGLSVGASWLAHSELTGRFPEPWRTCYLGPEPSQHDIGSLLQKSGLSYRYENNVQETIGRFIADGRVVARCTGPMEFGPRALGNRSILYHARDASVNKWLNERLNRSEFMPFAPATLDGDADRLYRNLEKCRASAKYMTITCDCTTAMKEEAPAAVHVDGTARPQLVSSEDQPDFHAILTEYRALSGQTTVINTSFNMHEEPIVCTADDAIRSFVAGGLDVLALGDFIVENREMAPLP